MGASKYLAADDEAKDAVTPLASSKLRQVAPDDDERKMEIDLLADDDDGPKSARPRAPSARACCS